MADRLSWKVRDGSESDMEGILLLRETVFGEMEKDRLDQRFWRWEYLEGPDGKAFIYIVEEGKRVIGHLSDLPKRFLVNGKVVPGVFHLELMVHPDYWRRGIFYDMEKYAVQYVKNINRLLMTACTVRQESINGLKKVGWKAVTEPPVLVYPIRFRGILNRYLHFSPLSFLGGGIARIFYGLFFRPKKKKEGEEIRLKKSPNWIINSINSGRRLHPCFTSWAPGIGVFWTGVTFGIRHGSIRSIEG